MRTTDLLSAPDPWLAPGEARSCDARVAGSASGAPAASPRVSCGGGVADTSCEGASQLRAPRRGQQAAHRHGGSHSALNSWPKGGLPQSTALSSALDFARNDRVFLTTRP